MLRKRVLLIIVGVTALGALSSALALWSTHGARGDQAVRALVWTVFGTPFALFWGQVLARRNGWLAVFWAAMVYFGGVLIAARIEWSLVGGNVDAYNGSKHALYFQLTIALQLLGSLAVALHAARYRGTIPLNPTTD